MGPQSRPDAKADRCAPTGLSGRPFEIWDGTGNDFVFLRLHHRREVEQFDGTLARKVCGTEEGVGVDGLFVYWVDPDVDRPLRARIWNSDGSEATMCGNALRCLAGALFADLGRLESAAVLGSRTVRLWAQSREAAAVALGGPEPVPGRALFESLPELDRIMGVSGSLLSFGNPHYVTIHEDLPEDWLERGQQVQDVADRLLDTGGINAGFLAREAQGGARTLMIYERGAGATQACGSGACAASAVLELTGEPPPHRFRLPGGCLEVDRIDGSYRLWGEVRRKGIGEWRWT